MPFLFLLPRDQRPQYIFFTFWQVGVASKKVLVQCPGALKIFCENEDEINELKATVFERAAVFERATAQGMLQNSAKAALCNIDAVATAMETMTAVDNDSQKIKGAMLW